MNFETVIGLEVHVELNTNSKIFSPTSAHFGNEQNTNTNVIDWSFPGVLPVLNKGVVDAGIKAALALNMDIHQHMHFDRKNYFYPDNPKAYQISQFDEPIGYNGWIEVQLEDGTTKIFLNTKGKIYNVSKELQDALRYLEKPIIKEDSLQLSKMIEAQFRKAMSDQKWRQDVKAMEIRYQELLQEGRIEGRTEGRNDREMEIVLGMIEEGASDEMILKYLKISKERLEQIKKNQKVHV